MSSGALLIVGATSPIARSAAERLAARGEVLILAARDIEELRLIAQDIRIRFNTEVREIPFDARNPDSADSLIDRAEAACAGELAGLYVFHGDVGSHERALADPDAAAGIIETNYLSVVRLLTPAANRFEERRRGFICVVSSVAGDRGRQSNYVYGGAKAGLSAHIQGLRNRLHKAGVPVTDVKPGFVDTAAIYGREGLFLVASPQRVAKSIVRAADRGRNIVYTPWFWRFIMLAVRLIPEPLFKRMSM